MRPHGAVEAIASDAVDSAVVDDDDDDGDDEHFKGEKKRSVCDGNFMLIDQ